MKVTVFAVHPSGGIRTYFSYIYGHKVMRGLQLRFVTPITSASVYFKENITNELCHIQAKPTLFSLFRELVRDVWKNRPDIIHSHGFTAVALASVPAKLMGIKHIATTHDILQDSQFSGFKGKLKRKVIGLLLSLPDVLNPVGEDAKKNLEQVYPQFSKNNQIKVIRNGIDTQFFYTEDVRNIRSEISLEDGALLLGFFGRFMSQKGFSLLVNAVDLWNSQEGAKILHVACFGWGGFIREEQQSLKERGLDSCFHFFPNTDEMPKALRGVDAVVMPSLWEACPLLPMETMVAGVPLIASNCIGTAEVVHDSPALVFEKGNLDGLLCKLKEFENNQDEIVIKADAFRLEAKKRFDVCETVKKLRSLYEGII